MEYPEQMPQIMDEDTPPVPDSTLEYDDEATATTEVYWSRRIYLSSRRGLVVIFQRGVRNGRSVLVHDLRHLLRVFHRPF